eukprot:TRINITY_DN34565_c0_g1_i1.p1 TRINITY_DN34565_c0_g1~~TRINITY_DN34565_c0_g1_i1.p1  ORF type:complete len:266 (+),score=47.78 TRINITY_DN34565_c0_g1_i1:66-863(+)
MGRKAGGGSAGSGNSHGGTRMVAAGRSQPSTPGPSRDAANNRANQMNPNNAAYHKARGATSRPSGWQDIVDAHRARGLREHALNMAAAETRSERAAHARDTSRVEAAARQALGGQAQVWKGGGRAKHNGLADGDLDLKIVAPQPFTSDDRNALVAALRQEFGSSCVSDSNPRIHRVMGEGGDIDIVPFNATFFDKGFNAGMPRNPFKFNRNARNAVRDVKLGAKERGQNVRGYNAERAVLEAQQQHPRARFETLADFANQKLFCR